jgi:hypothetical protein
MSRLKVAAPETSPHHQASVRADERVPAPLDTWTIKAIRVEPDPLSDAEWLPLADGRIN